MPTQISDLPPDLLQATIHEAERDADRVGRFLAKPKSKNIRYLPAEILLGIGAALRLLHWERAGIHCHLEAGLPLARQALYDLSEMAAGTATSEVIERVKNLPLRVTTVFVERFSWCGQAELSADLTLGAADEDAVLEDLADFYWAHRPK